MNHSSSKHRRLYSLLRDTHTGKYRHELVFGFSNGRTENSSDLSELEIDALISHLDEMSQHKAPDAISPVLIPGNKMRRRILSMCYSIGWTKINEKKGTMQVDYDKLLDWMIHYSYLHKPLDMYNPEELQILVKQFEHVLKGSLQA